MNERWKFQLKIGVSWGIFMVVVMSLFEMNEKPIMTEITLPRFYLKLAVYLAAGIFGLGYVNWRAKVKQENEK